MPQCLLLKGILSKICQSCSFCSLPGYTDDSMMFDSSSVLNRSVSTRRSNRSNRKKNREVRLGVKNFGYNSDDEASGDASGDVRPTTISRNLTWKPAVQRKPSFTDPTTDDASSYQPQSSGEVCIESINEVRSNQEWLNSFSKNYIQMKFAL